MEKLKASQILVAGAQLKAARLSPDDAQAIGMIEATKKKQSEILKLKEIDEQSLRMVVQL